jgi:hypothetical protein
MMEFNVPSEENPTRIEQRKTTTKKKHAELVKRKSIKNYF